MDQEKDPKAYQEKMEAQLMKMKADIQHLEAELKETHADAHAGLSDEMNTLRQKQAHLKDRMHSLKTASGAAWQEARDGVSSAWKDLEAAWTKARASFHARR